MICTRLINASRTRMKDIKVEKLIVGLGYISLKNSAGGAGLSYVLRNRLHGGCSHLEDAGNFEGKPLEEIAELFMDHHSPLKASLGLAAINSTAPHDSNTYSETDIIDLLNIRNGEKVGMVGRFEPLVKKILTLTPNLVVLEEPSHFHNQQDDKHSNDELKDCRIVIITATTLLNKTFEPILEASANADRKVLLGASTPLYPEFYEGTGINFASGVIVEDADRVAAIAAQGGGVRNFRGLTRKVTLLINSEKNHKKI
ncbi:MAG: DUF364 domain-containing protein [Firmicutes bacterium]|nr:DUF364 domain-containing protein [Bacillota bacterium]